jgi:hypothetical protein
VSFIAVFPSAADPRGEPVGKLPEGSPRHFLALRKKKKKQKMLRPCASGRFPALAGLALTLPRNKRLDAPPLLVRK